MRFVAIDGEGVTVDGRHKYVLMCDSEGRVVWCQHGIGTERALGFLLSQPAGAVLVGFGIGYDVNMLLRDLPEKSLRELWQNNTVTWRGYELAYVPGKFFRVKLGRRARTLCDVFGLFQTSFIGALDKWGLSPSKRVEEGKLARSQFTLADRTMMAAYCLAECRSLVLLMGRVEAAMRAAGIVPRGWYGAGCVAAAVLHREGIVPPAEVPMALHAYFGGRSELWRAGEFERVYAYDLVSAYPHAMLTLPYYDGFKCTRRLSEHGIYHVEWDCRGRVAPFPVRLQGRRIVYPLSGSGWYHACEIQAARECIPGKYRVIDGVAFSGPNDIFGFVRDLADAKVRYKSEGNPAEKIVKLAINSLYGKLAQARGWQGERPQYQCYTWAGEITARTRARLLRAMAIAPDNLIMACTDGLLFDCEIPLPLGEQLGNWGCQVYSNLFAAQAGFYAADGVVKTRGFFTREVDFEGLRDAWRRDGYGAEIICPTHRFVGLGSALRSVPMSRAWRTWQDGHRAVSLLPTAKTVSDDMRLQAPASAPPSLPYAADGMLDPDFLAGLEQPLRCVL
jgi:hypothetical protein